MPTPAYLSDGAYLVDTRVTLHSARYGDISGSAGTTFYVDDETMTARMHVGGLHTVTQSNGSGECLPITVEVSEPANVRVDIVNLRRPSDLELRQRWVAGRLHTRWCSRLDETLTRRPRAAVAHVMSYGNDQPIRLQQRLRLGPPR